MLLSEKLEQAKFSKSVAGYAVKEVDGFLGDILPVLREEEELMRVLRTKLSAFEAHTEEIEKREQEAYRVLEAAKQEAESMLVAARKNAGAIVAEAKAAAEARERAADAHAAEQLQNAERRSAERIDEAKKTAEMILAAADRKGRTMLAEAQARATAQSQSAKALAAECVAFEARFRTLAADTVRALSELKDDAPKPIVTQSASQIAAEPILQQSARMAQPETPAQPPQRAVPPAPVPESPKAESTPAAPEEESAARDIPFAGGQPISAYTGASEKPSGRKLYDTVTVSYESDDGYEDIRKLMEDTSGKKPTNPAHFCE